MRLASCRRSYHDVVPWYSLRRAWSAAPMLLDFEVIAYPHSGIISRETPSPGLDPKMLGGRRFLKDSKGPKRLRSWPWNRTLPAPFQEIVPPSLGAQKTTGEAAGQRERSGSLTAEAIWQKSAYARTVADTTTVYSSLAAEFSERHESLRSRRRRRTR